MAEKKKQKKRKSLYDSDNLDGGSRGGDSESDLGMAVLLAVLLPGCGCIVGLVWLIQGDPRGGKMVGLSLTMSLLYNVLGFVIQHMNQ